METLNPQQPPHLRPIPATPPARLPASSSPLSQCATAISTTKSIPFAVIPSRASTARPPAGGGGGGDNPTSGATGEAAPRDNAAASPNAVIPAVSDKTIHAGQSFHAHAMNSSLGDGTPLTARY